MRRNNPDIVHSTHKTPRITSYNVCYTKLLRNVLETLTDAVELIRRDDVRMVDLKFSDLWGRWHHVTIPSSQLNEQLMRDGVGFDGSSVGLKSVKSGDMVP